MAARVDHARHLRHVLPRRRDLRRRQQRLGGRRRRASASSSTPRTTSRRILAVVGDRTGGRSCAPTPTTTTSGSRRRCASGVHGADPAAPRRPAAVGADPPRRAVGRDLADGQMIKVAGTDAARAAHPGPLTRRRSASTPRTWARLHRRHPVPRRPRRDRPVVQRPRHDRRLDPRPGCSPCPDETVVHTGHGDDTTHRRRARECPRRVTMWPDLRPGQPVSHASVIRVGASSDCDLPTAAARRLQVRRRRDLGALPRGPGGHPPVPVSRCSQAATGSLHGYDVVDHTRINAELGGSGARRAGRGGPRAGARAGGRRRAQPHGARRPESSNAAAVGRAAHGRDAAHAHWFDVDWDALDGRIGLPVLGSRSRRCSRGRPAARRGRRTTGAALPRPRLPGRRRHVDGDRRRRGRLLAAQHYLLAGWRDKRQHPQLPAVLRRRLPGRGPGRGARRLRRHPRAAGRPRPRGIVEGFRIDHPDGLADPEGYLDRLRRRCGPAPRSGSRRSWRATSAARRGPATGTTGYDAAKRAITAALVDRAIAPGADRRLGAHRRRPSCSTSSTESKRAGRRRGAGARAAPAGPAGRARRCPTPTAGRLEEAVVELLVACEVYRAYVRPGSPVDELAAAAARRRLRAAAARPGPTSPTSSPQLGALADRPATARRRGRLRGAPPADLGTGDGQGRSRTPRSTAGTGSSRWPRWAATRTCSTRAAPSELHAWAATSSSTGRSA